jgi:hypothetical protein
MNFLNDYILDSDKDEDIVQVLEYERWPYTVRERVDNFEKWDDQHFHARFRMTKETVLSILGPHEKILEIEKDPFHCESEDTGYSCTLAWCIP